MNSLSYRKLDRRKRGMYKKYLDYSNSKVSGDQMLKKINFVWGEGGSS